MTRIGSDALRAKPHIYRRALPTIKFSKNEALFEFKKLQSDVRVATSGEAIEKIMRRGEFILANSSGETRDLALEEYDRTAKEAEKKVRDLRRIESGLALGGHVGPIGGNFGRTNLDKPLV